MKILSRVNTLLGLGNKRTAPPPAYQLITDGLVVTHERAEAWFELGTSNTDQASQDAVDAELADVIRQVTPILEGLDCHLRVSWGRITGDSYLDSLASDPTLWDMKRADWLDEFINRERRIFLGVVIDGARQDAAKTHTRRAAETVLGAAPATVGTSELAWLHGTARDLGLALDGTPWQVSLAPVESLGWLVSEQGHRGVPVPQAGTIAGTSLAALTNCKILPYSDHLRFQGERGETIGYGAVLALAEFPESIETPGDQEWLRTLAMIERTGYDGESVPITVDASVRFTPLRVQEALNRVNSTRELAREQRQSASKHQAGDTSEEIEETEAVMEEARKAINRSGLRLVEHHARIICYENTYEELSASVQAVRNHFAKIGMNAYWATDEQRELWLEQCVGDSLRVEDMGQITDAEAFFGAWWWGGSAVGEAAPTRMVGHLTGSTPGLSRLSFTSGSSRGDATTTACAGRSGRGKTTALMLSTVDVQAEGNCCTTWISTKGDDVVLIPFAQQLGFDADLITLDESTAGCADLFRSLDRQDAISHVATTLEILAPPSLRHVMASHGLALIGEEAETPNPTTWGVLQRLAASDDPDARALGNNLLVAARTRLGAPVLGNPAEGTQPFRSDPGLWMIQIPDFDLPQASNPEASDEQRHRLSLAVLRALTMHTMTMSTQSHLRTMRKLIVVPEVHQILNSRDGSSFLDRVARIGRASGTNLCLDGQDVTGLEQVPGVIEQLTNLVLFQFTSEAQLSSAVKLMDMPDTPESRQTIMQLAASPDENTIRHGHALVRDFRGRLGTVQFVYPDEHTEIMLATGNTSDEDRRRYLEEHPEWLLSPHLRRPSLPSYYYAEELEEAPELFDALTPAPIG